MSGYSLQELSDKTNNAISKQAIGKYEKGLMKPSFENLQAISKALNVKLDYFLRKTKLDLGEIKFRKQSNLPKKKQNEITEKTRDFIERYLEIESLLNETHSLKIQNKLIKVDNLDAIEKVSLKLRKSWRLGLNPIYNILETLEQKGIKIVYIDEEINHFSGMSTWVNDEIPVIVIAKNPTDRIRFTALHELGHLILNISQFDDKTQEKLCDRFAASMLLPAEALKEELGGYRRNIHLRELSLIKSEYGISPQAILYRAKDLGFITQSYFANQVKLLRIRGLWKEEIGSYKGEEQSNRLLQLLCRGISEEFITSSKAASLYNMKLSDFRREINKIDATSNN